MQMANIGRAREVRCVGGILRQNSAGVNICINLTRLVEAAKGSGGAGWFGIEISRLLSDACSGVVVVAATHNAAYVRKMLATQIDGGRLSLVVEDHLGQWLWGSNGSTIDVYIDPLNGLEPHHLPSHIASIAVIHDLMFMRDPYVFTDQEIEFRCDHYGDAMHRADLVMTVAQREADDIASLLPGKPIFVVNQPAYFRGEAPSAPSDRPRMLFSPGVQWNHKNHFRLVCAFLQLLEESRIDPATRLCLSDVLPIEANHQLLRPLLRQSPWGEAVVQIPYLSRERFGAFLERCDGIVLPSIHEGYGIPLVEAVVTGKPILTTRVPSVQALAEIPDFVRFLDRPKDVAAIADALENFVVNLPHAKPQPNVGPTEASFLSELLGAIDAALAARRHRSEVKPSAKFDITRRSEGCTLLTRFDGADIDEVHLAKFDFAAVKLFGGHIVSDDVVIACGSANQGTRELALAHEVLLSETRLVLIASSGELKRLEPQRLVQAQQRLLNAKGKAKVRLVDIGLSTTATDDCSLALPTGLYDLDDLKLPFEASLDEIIAHMEQAPAVYQPTAQRALILDPSLKNPNGHHLAVATSLAKSLSLTGYHTSVACNFAMTLHAIDGANETLPVLTDYLYEQCGDIGLAQCEFENAFLCAGVGQGDLVFAFCATPTMLVALTLQLAQSPIASRPNIVIRFDRPEWRTPPTSVGYEEAFELIRAFGLRDYFSFTVESKGLQECFELSSGEVFPIRFNHVASSDARIDAMVGQARQAKPGIRISYVGEAREEKGFHHLPAILRIVLAAIDGIDVHFRIQCGANTWNQTPPIVSAKQELLEMAREDNRIELLDGALPEDEYLELIRSADIVFLPYFPPQYRIRGSGVATEAAAYGTEMVISHGLDITATYADAMVTESENYSVPALAQALIARIAAIAAGDANHQRQTATGPADDLAGFALSFIQPPPADGGAGGKIALWVANDTRGEGSDSVYRSQIEYLSKKGYFVIKLTAPYPARWRLDHPWQFDATAFARTGEIVMNFQPGQHIELIMDKLAHGGDVLNNFIAAWDKTTVPPLVENIIEHCPPDIAVVNYAHHYRIIERLVTDRVPMIVETHDIQAIQYAIQQEREVDPRQLAKEMALVSNFDQIVSISNSEAAVFSEYCGRGKVTWCMPFVDERPIHLKDRWTHDLIFVGSAHHANMESLRWFIEKVYAPMLYPQGVSLAIVGSAGHNIDVERFGDRVTCPGRVEDLAPWYEDAGVAVLPVVSGAGVPIKVIDAMTRGVPFVLADYPAAAMSLDDSIPLAHSPMQFAEQVLACLASHDERERRSAAGRAFTARYASRDSYYSAWDGMMARLPHRQRS